MMDKINSSNHVAMETNRSDDRRANEKRKAGKSDDQFGAELAAANQTAPAKAEAAPVQGQKPDAGTATDAQTGATKVAAAGADGAEQKGVEKSAAPIPGAKPSLVEEKVKQLKAGEVANEKGAKGEEATNRVASAAMRSPLTMKSAASMNTAGSIAGLNPWSKEWVFQQGDDENPELKGLFGPAAKSPMLPGVGQNLKGLPQTRSDNGASAVSPEGAKELAAAGVDPKQLENILRELNGAMEVVNPQMGTAQATGNAGAAVRNGKTADGKTRDAVLGGNNLSGAEFLGTLGAVRVGENGQRAGTMSQGFGDGSSGQNDFDGEIGTGAKTSKPGLSVIEGGLKSKRSFADEATSAQTSSLGMHSASGLSERVVTPAPVTVTGHVVSGQMAQDRLSSESLIGMSAGMRTLTAQGGGEMHVRLKPDNLGELHLKVVTNGNSVGLQIQASDDKAKKILEESLTHLKDSLSSQNLRLASVDISIATPAGASADMNQDSSAFQHGMSRNWDGNGQNANQSHGDSGSKWAGSGEPATGRSMSGTAVRGLAGGVSSFGSANNGSAVQGSGRLDVMA